jgi:hypothetical protein
MWRGARCLLLVLVAAVLSIARAAPAAPTVPEAQHKPPIPVSFLAHHAEWLDVLYPPSARDRVAPLLAQAEDARAELAELLGQPPLFGVEVRVARGPEEIATLAPQIPAHRASAAGIAYPGLKLIVLSLGAGGEPSDLAVAFKRQLAEVALHQATAGRDLPDWFTEGLTLYFSGDNAWARRWLLLRASVRRTLVALSSDAADRPSGDEQSALLAAEGADFVAWLLAPERRTRFATVTDELRRKSALRDGIGEAYGAPFASLESAWRRNLVRRSTLSAIGVAVGLPLAFIGVALLARALRRRRVRAEAAKLLAPDHARASTVLDRARVHIVLSRREERPVPPPVEPDVPKVEHEGGWHTLH